MTQSRLAKRHLKDTSKKVLDDHKVLEKQDLLMTQLSICQDQIEKEIKRLTGNSKREETPNTKMSFKRLACLNCGKTGLHNHSVDQSQQQCGDNDKEHRELSLNSMLEDEGLKNNEVCNTLRDLLKKQVNILKADDLKLIGDDTTLIRMINFFNEYKKRYEEWKRRQAKKEEGKIKVKKNRSKDSLHDEEDEDAGRPAVEEESRREKNLRAGKLKPFQYPSLTEEPDKDDPEVRRQRSLENSLKSARMSKEPIVIKDRSIEGNDRVYQPDLPENVLYVEDASVQGDPSTAGSKYYLTEGERSVSGKRKVTLNLRIPKSKLKNLKNIRALIRTRDPATNALVSKEKNFNLDYVAETVSVGDKKKTYHFRNNGEGSVKTSVHDKSTELASNLPSLAPDPRRGFPVAIEKLEFGRGTGQSPDAKSSID